ncbi:MAG TPA: M48 family metalloprotease [Methanothermobacter sp.]|nr:M48 family metalloprotease [Methanothermobacter sp.]HPQ05126.1 M48 family metalloprotease [Methanothermobacter sp.]HPU37341.1 M48 family metalloprotease [Methanothermobacter sp.]
MLRRFIIKTEVAPAYYVDLLDFILKYFSADFQDARIVYDRLIFSLEDPGGVISGEVKVGETIEIILSYPLNLEEKVERLYDDIFFVIQLFEDELRKSTLYFAWVEGQDIIPEKPSSLSKRISKVLFGSNLLLLFIIFLTINIILFILIGLYAVVVIFLMQFAIILLADKIYAVMGEWQITSRNPLVHILMYQLPGRDFKFFREVIGDFIVDIKKEIYEKSLALGQSPSCELGREILARYGFKCTPLNEKSKVINVHGLVKSAASKFGIPTPKVVVSNTMLPNAAATGPSPNRGLILLTTGLLTRLDDEELLSVIGHELAHLIGRDPIILFSIIFGEFMLRLTVLLPIVVMAPLVYIIFIFWLIFFVAKFFEARADLLSAIVIGKPDKLAMALQKIGYGRLRFESGLDRIFSWLFWDPHPPLYFRIRRLKNLKVKRVKSPLLESARDVIGGFIDSIRFF